jgi:hypothetical protein
MDPELKKLFRKGEALQTEMRTLFLQNNIEVGRIDFLPKKSFTKWKILHEKSIKITKKISEIVTNNGRT